MSKRLFVRNHSYEKMNSPYRFIFIQIKLIFIWKVLHEASFWNGGTRELGNIMVLSVTATKTSEFLLHLTRISGQFSANVITSDLPVSLSLVCRNFPEYRRLYKRLCVENFQRNPLPHSLNFHVCVIQHKTQTLCHNFSRLFMLALRWNELICPHHPVDWRIW